MNDDLYKEALRKIKRDSKCKPQCCYGPTGPTGPTGSTPTIDSILVDNDGTQTVATNNFVNLGEIINSTGMSILYTPPTTITLNEPGTYLIQFDSLISNATTAGDVGASMLINGTVVPNASEYVSASNTQAQFVLQHSVTITELTTVEIKNMSTVSNSYHDTSLSIIKLG